jgi:hypothetical protein
MYLSETSQCLNISSPIASSYVKNQLAEFVLKLVKNRRAPCIIREGQAPAFHGKRI